MTSPYFLLTPLTRFLCNLLHFYLLHILLEVIDLIDIDGEAFLDGAGRQVEVVIGELLELDVASLGVAAWG